jgi:hypothetical protein
MGAGAGAVNPSVAAAAIGTVPVTKSGMASGLNSSFRILGVAIGVALLGAIIESEVASSLTASLGAAPSGLVDVVASGNVDAVAAQGGPDATGAAESAFISGFDTILLVAAVIAFVGAVLAVTLIRETDFERAPAEAALEPTAA